VLVDLADLRKKAIFDIGEARGDCIFDQLWNLIAQAGERFREEGQLFGASLFGARQFFAEGFYFGRLWSGADFGRLWRGHFHAGDLALHFSKEIHNRIDSRR